MIQALVAVLVLIQKESRSLETHHDSIFNPARSHPITFIPVADHDNKSNRFGALDRASHNVVAVAEPRPVQSPGAHRLFPEDSQMRFKSIEP